MLLLGASGFIGSAVAARLHLDKIEVRRVLRPKGSGARPFPQASVALDLRTATRPEDWLPHLGGIGAVVNCAGVFQDNGRDSTAAVHLEAPAALYRACEQAGVRRVVHISAMGAQEKGLTPFSRTKHDAEMALKARDLDWVILRPSVVVGRAAYGGSALVRGLAALPMLPRVAGAGLISVVQLDDVVETVVAMLRRNAPLRVTLDLAGPQALSFEAIVARYRNWLGWAPASLVGLPRPVMRESYLLGDIAGWLGWRPAIRSTAMHEMGRGAQGDPDKWSRLTGIIPRSLDEALAGEPVSVQDRWFARLFLLKPLMIAVFALFWILTGIVSLGPGYAIGEALMREGGAGAWSGPSVIAGALADLAIGLGILWRPSTRYALWAALALTIFYVVAGTAILPRLWSDPLGPMMKVWPILAFNLATLAILDER